MLEIRRLRKSDLPAALGLSTQAGWNQAAADWRRLLTSWPTTCLAGCLGDRLVATATLAVFVPVGWIGMILVEQSQRRQGYGGEFLARSSVAATALGLDCLGLDATDLGQPVYLQHGFAARAGIDRWTGPAAEVDSPTDPAAILPLAETHWPQVIDLDRRRVGVDRGGLLRRLAGEESASARVVLDGRQVVAAGFSRRGRTAGHVGPILAENVQAGETVLAGLLADRYRIDGPAAVFVDVPRGGALATALRTRLRRPAQVDADGPARRGDGRHDRPGRAGCRGVRVGLIRGRPRARGRGQVHVFGRSSAGKTCLPAEKWTSPQPNLPCAGRVRFRSRSSRSSPKSPIP